MGHLWPENVSFTPLNYNIQDAFYLWCFTVFIGWFSDSQLCFGFLLLYSSHPLQWAKCSYFFQSMFPVGCLMLCNSCLRVLQPPSHSRSVYPLAYHQNVSVSRQPVFVKLFVIILRPPLGCASKHLCKCVPLRLTLTFRRTSFWRRVGKTHYLKATSK